MQHGQSLHDLLVQAKPGWSQQDVQAAERKLAKVGVTTCPELAAALDDVNARLQEAGLQRFSAETVGALGRSLASSPAGVVAAGGPPPPPKTGPSALVAVQPGPGGSSFRAQLQASQSRGKFGGKGAAGLITPSSLERPIGNLPGARLHKGGKGGFAQQGPRLGAVAGAGAEAPGAQPPAGRWEGWALLDLPRAAAAVPRPLSKEAAAKAQAEESDEEEDEDEEEEEEERLSEAELLKLCRAKAIPLDQLESSKKAVQVLRLFERLEKSPASTLKNEYKTRGFAPDVGMRKEALLARVKEVVIWEHLRVERLRSICEAQGLAADESLQRGQLLQLLADASWLARGVPLQRLPNLVVAHGVLDSIDGLAARSTADLAAQARRLGAPLEARPDREDLLPRLRAALVWKQMEAPELRAECEARGAPLDAVPEAAAARPAQPMNFMLDSSKGGLMEKQALERLLMQSLWLDVWAAAGISVRSLGSHAAAGELFQAVERLRAEGLAALQESYQALDLPMKSSSDRRFILQRLSEALFWKALPLARLREACRERRLEPAGLDGEDGADEEAERRSLTRALLCDACSRAWVAQGIPVKRLETAEAAAAVAEEWGRLQGISDQDLRIQCELHGLPKEAGLEKEDLVSLLKEVAVWEALPLRELRLETAKLESAGGAVQPGTTAAVGDDWAEQCRLVERLLLDRCAGAYDAKGIPARQLGSLKAAAKLAGQWAALDAMGTDGLREECLRLGMPSQNLQRQELLVLARDVALWRQLPLADLQLACRAKGVAPPEGVSGGREEDQRELLVDALLVERCEAFYERRGIPVRRLGSVQAAARVAERWGRLESMSAGDLLLKASAYGVHAEAGLDRADLMDRLKSAMLWAELPFKELQKECRYYGINSIAHPHERRELAQRLCAFLWAPAPPPPPQPKPQPRPQARPPPGGAQQRKPAAPPPRRPPPSQQTAVTKHLRTLGLPATATAQEIKKAYRRLALRYHPDKNLEASQEEASRRFREVAEAYAALAERVKRG